MLEQFFHTFWVITIFGIIGTKFGRKILKLKGE